MSKEFRKYNPPLSREMVAFRVEEIQRKLQIEEKVSEAVTKYHNTTANYKEHTSKESQQQARLKLFDATEKARIYSLALRELKPLILATVSNTQGALPRNPGIRQPVTGRLTVRLLAEQNLPHSDESELMAALQIDGVAKGTPFKLSSSAGTGGDRRTHVFNVDVERANEMELLVLGQSRDWSGLIGLLWIPLAEIVDDLRMRQISTPGWAPADSSGTIRSSAAVNSSSSSYANVRKDPEVIEDWFKLEPAGKLLLRIGFAKGFKDTKPKSRLGRQGAVRKGRLQVVASVMGHQFGNRHIYRPLVCPVCRKFAINSTEYQCQACAANVRAKCITSSSGDAADKRRSLHQFYNIPHRFETSVGLAAYWCCHCGQMLSLVGGNSKKCTDCDLACHASCQHFVPNFCGMTHEMANQLIGVGQDPSVLQTPPKSPFRLSGSIPNPIFEILPPPGEPKANNKLTPPYQKSDLPPERVPIPVSPIIADHSSSQPILTLPNPLPPSKLSSSSSSSTPITIFPPAPVSPRPPTSSPVPSKCPLPASPTPLVESSQIPTPAVKKPQAKPTLRDYKLVAVLGRGNFGKVLLAQTRTTKSVVAIKVLKKDAALANEEVDALRNERKVFQMAAKARHPFLVSLHACFTTDSSVVFVMDYVVGGDLMSLIQRLRVFQPKQALFYTVEVVLALEFFHSKNIVYRDLKLDNILLDHQGHVRVADYGLCKLNMPYGALTTTFCGTPEFMAPEILEDQKYGRAVDWWSLGVLMYQMILGQSPFTGADDTEIFEAILEDEVLFPPTLPRATVSILQKLLTRNAQLRLGGSAEGVNQVKRHPYFRDVDWDLHLKCQVPPPYVPSIRDPLDVANFDPEFTDQLPTITPSNSTLGPSQQRKFDGFDFVAD